MTTVAVLGRIGYDLYSEDRGVPLHQVRHFRSGLGGSSANIAVGLARLGFHVHMLGAVADDALGRFLLDHLSREGVDVACVQSVRGHNVSLALTEVSPPHRFEQVFYRADPADARVAWTEAMEQAIGASPFFVTNGTSLCCDPGRATTLRALEAARRSGATTAFDTDYRASSWPSEAEAGVAARGAWPLIDVLFANAEEMRVLARTRDTGHEEQTTREALAAGVRVFIWKRAERGAVCFTQDTRLEVPAYDVGVTSTIGAGDAFATGFLYALAQAKPLAECLRYGHACAACVVREVGCAEAMPTLEQLQALMRTARVRAPH